MKICQMIGESDYITFYTECLKCRIRTCPIKHLMERIEKLEVES